MELGCARKRFLDDLDFQTTLMISIDVLPIASPATLGDMGAWWHASVRRCINDFHKCCTSEVVLTLRDFNVDYFTGNDGGHEYDATVIKSRQPLAPGNQLLHRDPVRAIGHFSIVESYSRLG